MYNLPSFHSQSKTQSGHASKFACEKSSLKLNGPGVAVEVLVRVGRRVRVEVGVRVGVAVVVGVAVGVGVLVMVGVGVSVGVVVEVRVGVRVAVSVGKGVGLAAVAVWAACVAANSSALGSGLQAAKNKSTITTTHR